jgi:hypothetical protein
MVLFVVITIFHDVSIPTRMTVVMGQWIAQYKTPRVIYYRKK